MIRIAFAALMALCFFPALAFAADTTVDLSGTLGRVLDILLTGLAAVALWLGRKGIDALQERTGLELDEQLKNRIDEALFRALHYGKAKTLAAVEGRSITVDVKSELLAHALDYAQEAVPQALEYFGVDRARLLNMLEARLGVDLDHDGDVGDQPA